MRILGVVPARGSSKRIPRKNLQRVDGLTLVARAFLHAEGAHLIDHWVVSTDDPEVAEHVPPGHRLMRPSFLALDDTPMAPVLLHAAEATGGNWDAVVTIQPTSPLRTARDIDRCIFMWVEDIASDLYDPQAVVSVNADSGERNGAVYVTNMCLLRDGDVFQGPPDKVYPMPAARSLDINTPEDLEEARRILG